MNKHHQQNQADLDALLRNVRPEEEARLREVWALAGGEEPVAYPGAEAVAQALAQLEAAIDDASDEKMRGSRNGARPVPARATDRPPQSTRLRFGRRRMLMGMAVVLLAGVLVLEWWLRPVVHMAVPGERLTLVLPDGSHVELNSGSTVRYARRFGDVRAVHLEGEAFFAVEKEARPFVVRTFNAEVRVLGTRFNVRAWPRSLENSTTIALEAGKVALTPAGWPERTVVMEPGDTRRVRAGGDPEASINRPAVSVSAATAWRSGDLVFKDQWFGVVLDDVARRFDVRLEVSPPSLRRKRLNLALRQPAGAEAVVRDLALALGLRYRPTADGYELYRPPQ